MAGSSDPYRASGDESGSVVLAQGGRNTRILRLVFGLGCVAATSLGTRAESVSPLLVVASFLFMPYAVLTATRGVHAWFIPHLVVARPKGLRVAWSKKIILLPWLRRFDRELPWSAVGELKTHTYTVNGVSDSALHITTPQGVLEIPDDGFDVTASTIQQRLLDYLDRQSPRDPKASSDFARLCAARFERPVRWEASPSSFIFIVGLTVAIVGFFGFLAVSMNYWLTHVLLLLAVGTFGFLSFGTVKLWLAHRFLTLDGEGLSLGSRSSPSIQIPWRELRGVRRERTNGELTGLELLREGSDSLRLTQRYPRSFDELADLLDPSTPDIAQALELMRDGLSPQKAIDRAGLSRPMV
ncbi:MAG: hypothetical protein AAF799_33835 [Myxococcota bacterium]